MSKIKTLSLYGLVLITVLSACNAMPTPAEAVQPRLPGLTATLPMEAASATPAPIVAATVSANPSPAAVATSRGPNLEASDPATVQLASGSLQLVEFFRFT